MSCSDLHGAPKCGAANYAHRNRQYDFARHKKLHMQAILHFYSMETHRKWPCILQIMAESLTVCLKFGNSTHFLFVDYHELNATNQFMVVSAVL